MILVPKRRYLTEVPDEVRRSAPASQRVGVIVSQAYEGGPAIFMDLVACAHCGRLWPYCRGSGVERGWCMNCGKLTCGSDECDVCVPSEQLIKNMEAGMDYHTARKHKPITARVEAAPPRQSPGGVILGRS